MRYYCGHRYRDGDPELCSQCDVPVNDATRPPAAPLEPPEPEAVVQTAATAEPITIHTVRRARPAGNKGETPKSQGGD